MISSAEIVLMIIFSIFGIVALISGVIDYFKSKGD